VEVSRLYFDGKRQVSALDSPFEAKGTDYKYIYSSYELFPFLIAPKTRSCLPFCVGEIVLKNGYAVGKNFVSCKAVNYTNSNGSKPNNTAAQVNKIYGPSDTQYNGFYPSYTCPYADDCK
ncbi:MAG: hypothetical protein WCQ53_02360, partial [bacterium]